jgi:hypothetical protein
LENWISVLKIILNQNKNKKCNLQQKFKFGIFEFNYELGILNLQFFFDVKIKENSK